MHQISFVVCMLFCTGCAYLSKIPDAVPSIEPEISPNMMFVNKCIDDLGCFYTGPPFYHISLRRISLPPQDAIPKFHLYTRDNPEEGYDLEINNESLEKSTFNPKLQTKFVIHGFLSDLKAGDIRHDIRRAFLKHGNYNVIIVDWTEHNGFPYAQAASNIRVAGAEVAQLIHFLIKNAGITAESVHIIGHSLGGQMAGYVGERVPKLGSITGLDPAGPFFQGLVPEVCLDISDAVFVDVIHSNGAELMLNGFGTKDPIGHVDFYPNGGEKQPGCFHPTDSVDGAADNLPKIWQLNVCDHGRANEYFLESIDNSKCKFSAVQCGSYMNFEKGLCPPKNSTVNEMGFHAQPLPNVKPPIKFFLRTNGSALYCIEGRIFLWIIDPLLLVCAKYFI